MSLKVIIFKDVKEEKYHERTNYLFIQQVVDLTMY